MRTLALISCALTAASILVGLAGAAEPTVGVLSVVQGKGVVTIDVRGYVLGRLTSGTLRVTDVTPGYAQINVQGPRSRELLASVTDADMSNEVFPFRTAAEIAIGFARVLCIRITYLGELGYELYIPAEQAVHVYDWIVEAGAKLGVVHAGLRALGSLRMEKGYRDYGHDLDNTDDPYETGLGFAVDLFFSRQNRWGRWRRGRPLFHYPDAGNAYCYDYDRPTYHHKLPLETAERVIVEARPGLAGEGLHQPDDPGLRRGVVRLPGVALHTHHRRERDDGPDRQVDATATDDEGHAHADDADH